MADVQMYRWNGSSWETMNPVPAKHSHSISDITNLSTDMDKRMFLHSSRNFANGTIITTSIDYSKTNGDPFYLEIRGNSYGDLRPFDIKIQGYIYNNTIINYGGTSTGKAITGLIALNVGGKLTFWFPRQAYWHGFDVYCIIANSGRRTNLVESISDGVKPTGTKEVNMSSGIKQVAYIDEVYSPTNKPSVNVLPNRAGIADQISNYLIYDCNLVSHTGWSFADSSTQNKPPNVVDCGILSHYYSSYWVFQMAYDWNSHRIFSRQKKNNVWSAWRELAYKDQPKHNIYVDGNTIVIQENY